MQGAQNFRSGQDDQHVDARGPLEQTLQMVKIGWTFCSMEDSESIRLVC